MADALKPADPDETLDAELALVDDEGQLGASLLEAQPACNLTGLGNANRFVFQHALDLRYLHPLHQWYVWDGRRFQKDETGAILRRAKDTVGSIYAEAARVDDSAQRKAIADWAKRSESEAHLREMINLATCDLPIRAEQLDANPWYLTVENGTINLRTGQKYPHSRGDFSTKLAPVSVEEGATCPTWLSFLDRILDGNQDLIRFLQRAVGYSLTGETGEQVLFFLHGTGCNGKSTFLELLSALLGDYAKQAPFTAFLEHRNEGPRNDIAMLRGARFVASIEAGEGHRLAEGLVKQLTGGDTITARFLHKEFFEFRPQFKLWLAANHKPIIRGTDHAIWRRIRLIPFTVTIPDEERDPELPTKLRGELPGILQWAIEGCLAWQCEGLGTAPAVRDATEAYRSEMDLLAGFLDDRCELGRALTVEAAVLYQAYVSWCETNGERPTSQRAFGLRLKDRGLDQSRGSAGVRRWTGLHLVTQVTDSDAGFHKSPMNFSREGNYRKEASPSVTCVTPEKNGERPLCSVHGATQRRRRDGTWRCPECIPNNPANPYTVDHHDPVGSGTR